MATLFQSTSLLRAVESASLYGLVVFPPLAAGATQLWAFCLSLWMGALGIGAMVLRRRAEGRRPFPSTGLLFPAALMMALAGASLLVSIYTQATVAAGLRVLLYVAAMCLAAEAASSRARSRSLVMIMMASAGTLVLIGLLKYAGGPVPWFWRHGVFNQYEWLTSTFYNHNHLSGYLEMVLPLVGCVVIIWRPFRRNLWVVCLGLIGLGIVLAMSRGGWVATAVAAGFCSAFLVRGHRLSKPRLAAWGLAGALLIYLAFTASTPALDRMASIDNPGEASFQVRLSLWEGTGELIRQRPFMGWGLGTYPWSFTQVRPPGLIRKVREAHCDYLQILAGLGFLVWVPLIWAGVVIFRRGLKTSLSTRSALKQSISLGSLGGIIAILVHSLVDFNIQITSNGILFFVLAGLAVGVPRQGTVRPALLDNPDEPKHPEWVLPAPPKEELQRRKVRLAAGAAVVGAVLVAGAYFLAIAASADLENSSGKRLMAVGAPEQAMAAFKVALEQNPLIPEYFYRFAQGAMAQSGAIFDQKAIGHNMEAADWACRAALELNPREGNTWYLLAQTNWWSEVLRGSAQPSPEVGKLFGQALKQDPSNGRFLLGMVRFHLARGETAKSLVPAETLGWAQPEAYKLLQREAAWRSSLKEAFRKGLLKTLDNRLTWRTSREALFHIAENDKNWSEASKYLGEILERLGPRVGKERYFRYGWILLNQGEVQKAEEAYKTGLQYSSNQADDLGRLNWHFTVTRQMGSYMTLVKDTARANPGLSLWQNMELGKIYLKRRRLPEAEEYFKKALAIKESAGTLAWLAKVYLAQKNWSAAELASAKATMRDKTSPEYLYIFARSLHGQGKYQAALGAAQAAISQSRKWQPSYFSLRGWSHYHLGRYKLAIKDWKLAWAASPGSWRYPMNIGDAYAKINQLQKAKKHYQMALEKNPGSVLIKNSLQKLGKR